MVRILIVDQERSVRNILKERMEFEGYYADTAGDLPSACEMADKNPYDIIIASISFFIEFMEKGGVFHANTLVIVMADTPSIDEAVSVMRMQAFDYVGKLVNMNRLLLSVKRASELRESLVAGGETREHINPFAPKPKIRRSGKVEDIMGESRAINLVKILIDKVAPSDARVLITGPNGTGKELVAKWLHEKSSRNSAPFIEVNCAAIPSELIESELFGHEKGAFTSAIRQRKGKFEQADGGTLFLDEIGDMSLSAQAKVLRALQENRICRVGSDRDLLVDVRVVAATNKNLRDEISKGNFREDLYHRLSVIVIRVPPLVDRIDDIPILVDYFIDKISSEYGISSKHIDDDAIEELQDMEWTGNIRELRNVVERLIILSGDNITCDDVKIYARGVMFENEFA